jgi:hypothetical protein
MKPSWRSLLLIFVFSSFGIGIILILDGIISKKLSLVGIGIITPLIVGITFFYFDRKLKK